MKGSLFPAFVNDHVSNIRAFITFFFLRSLSLDVETASRTILIYEGRTSLGVELITLDNASQATC